MYNPSNPSDNFMTSSSQLIQALAACEKKPLVAGDHRRFGNGTGKQKTLAFLVHTGHPCHGSGYLSFSVRRGIGN